MIACCWQLLGLRRRGRVSARPAGRAQQMLYTTALPAEPARCGLCAAGVRAWAAAGWCYSRESDEAAGNKRQASEINAPPTAQIALVAPLRCVSSAALPVAPIPTATAAHSLGCGCPLRGFPQSPWTQLDSEPPILCGFECPAFPPLAAPSLHGCKQRHQGARGAAHHAGDAGAQGVRHAHPFSRPSKPRARQ